jgi:hypothetical protein
MDANTIQTLAILGGIIVLAFLLRYVIIGSKKKKKDGYDLEALSRGEFPTAPAENSFVDKVGKQMNIKNFKAVCDNVMVMLKEGRKEEAVSYMSQMTGIEKERAEKIVSTFAENMK